MTNLTVFITHCCTTIYNHTRLHHLGEGGVKPSRKALTALQRGPRGIATSAPSQHDGVPVAMPGGPRWSENAVFLPENGHQKVAEFCKKTRAAGPLRGRSERVSVAKRHAKWGGTVPERPENRHKRRKNRAEFCKLF